MDNINDIAELLLQPLTLPDTGAARDDSGNLTTQVKHLAATDERSWQTISQSTRQLEARDLAIQDTLNNVISVVNQKEQYAAIPPLRTILPPGSSTVAANFRIPNGLVSRILNLSVYSSVTGSARAEIQHSPNTFGQSSGDLVIVTTKSEFTAGQPSTSDTTVDDSYTAGTSFFVPGEFIVIIYNDGTTEAEIVVSALFTLLPLGIYQGGNNPLNNTFQIPTLAPSSIPNTVIVQNTRTITGQQGPQGPSGPVGLNLPPKPWASTTTFNPRDVVQYQYPGYGMSTWVVLQTVTGSKPPLPTSQGDANYALLAAGGSVGPQGSGGVAGLEGSGFNFRGEVVTGNSTVIYEPGDVVTVFGGAVEQASQILTGLSYVITYVGTTTFTSYGAAANTVGTFFVSNSSSVAGTGMARLVSSIGGTDLQNAVFGYTYVYTGSSPLNSTDITAGSTNAPGQPGSPWQTLFGPSRDTAFQPYQFIQVGATNTNAVQFAAGAGYSAGSSTGYIDPILGTSTTQVFTIQTALSGVAIINMTVYAVFKGILNVTLPSIGVTGAAFTNLNTTLTVAQTSNTNVAPLQVLPVSTSGWTINVVDGTARTIVFTIVGSTQFSINS